MTQKTKALATSIRPDFGFVLVEQYSIGTQRHIGCEFFIRRDSDNDLRIISSDGDLWEDCDFDGRQGLLWFDGELWTKTEAWDTADEDARQDFEDQHGIHFGEFDQIYSGEWRQATAADAVKLGLVLP